MNWLTTEGIKRRAEESPEEALNVSIEHWEQICEAIKIGKSASVHYGEEDCGLCARNKPLWDACSKACILYEKDNSKMCCQEWRAFAHEPTLPNAQAMLNRLYMERGKGYDKIVFPKKECKKEKPALRYGDYGLCKRGDRLWGFVYSAGSSDFYFLVDLKEALYAGHYVTVDEIISIDGNFDDLKRNAEDLEEVRIPVKFQSAYIRIQGDEIQLAIENGCDNLYMELEVATKIAHAILQEAATAKRKPDSSYKK